MVVHLQELAKWARGQVLRGSQRLRTQCVHLCEGGLAQQMVPLPAS